MPTLADTPVRDLMKTSKGRKYLRSISSKTPLKRHRPEAANEDVPFVFWDGEGTSGKHGNRPAYVLFGSTEGHKLKGRKLSGRACLELLLQGKEDYPDSYHVIFAGSYDVNMILHHCVTVDEMPLEAVDLLREGHAVTWAPDGSDGATYTLKYVPKKIFTVSDGKRTMELFDSFTFFGTKFVKAVDEYLGAGSVPDEVVSGKDKRNSFTYKDIDDIENYWEIEGDLGRQLMESLRDKLNKVNIDVKQWYGPGAVARAVMHQNHIKNAMNRELPRKVQLASQHAYFGGRFERFRIGRANRQVFGFDVNSAYPYALTQVPNLATATWRRVLQPKDIKDFSLYKVTYDGYGRKASSVAPHPLPWRSKEGNIGFLNEAKGWYWGCEVKAAQRYVQAAGGTITVHEGWVCKDDGTRPFDFISSMYEQRREMKKKGLPEQLALKLALNSMYGKLAQQIGAKYIRGKWSIPEFHQLEWAGYVTAKCRAMILDACALAPNNIVAIETDGVYTTKDFGFKDSKELGGWERSVYKDMVYLDSGIYWGLKGKEWTVARFRGVGGAKTSIDDALKFLQRKPTDDPTKQPVLETETVMFRTMGDHLFDDTWCHWVPETRLIGPWRHEGKRFHLKAACPACRIGKRPSAGFHDTIVPPELGHSMSARHKLLWVDGETWMGDEYHVMIDDIEDAFDEW